ncbi:TRAP transporter large permease subunit [Geomicrobium sp. JCM 19038]|uniref:TRAP transporter large permease subunit n=1 Tax=Geomicrobium sp. JCM 19038 TaxID=1460635 RepID=UPI00045F4482|nr:TRAP transporter large permease subunit [Geomicrobium sp. JCM 19038]GAK07929.1 hypothetical protein JCM19038_1683 [Geomicrobium sp. JCM 19038]
MEVAALLVPMLLLFVIALTKAIPIIGGDVRIALLAAAVASALFAQLTPLEMVTATIDGIDRLAWVIMLSLVGSIYAEAQVRIGAMETTLSSFRSIFGNSSKGLLVSVFLTLILAGSLLGDAIAAATVIGLLVVPALSQLKLKPEQIGMIILIGASLGSIMPPISQGVFLSASLVGIEPTNVLNVAYITVGIGSLFAIVESFRFVKGKKLPEHLRTKETLGSIIVKRWHTMIPLVTLAIIVILNTGFSYNIFELPLIAPMIAWIQEVPIIQGLAFPVVLAIVVALFVSFLFSSVRSNGGDVVKTGLTKVSKTVQIQLCAGVMSVCSMHQERLMR